MRKVDVHHFIALCVLVWFIGALIQLMRCGFVLDDVYLILNNRWLNEGTSLGQLMGSDLWAGESHPDKASGYYRPVFLLSIWFDHLIFGNNPLGYHLQSMVWQLLSAFFCWRLLKGWGFPSADFAAAVFLLHPIQTETLYWIVARNDTMACSFALLNLLLWSSSGSRLKDILGGVCMLLAFGSKESSLFLIPMLIYLFRSQRIALTARRLWLAILVPTLFFALRFISQPGEVFPTSERWMALLMSSPEWLTYMLGKLFVPFPLASHMPIGWLVVDWYHYLGLGCVAALFVYIWRYEAKKALWPGALCILSAFLCVIPPLAQHGLIGDRYLALALLGVCIWIASLPEQASRWSSVILIGFVFFSVNRGTDWKDDLHIWTAADRDYPSSFTEVSLGHIYYNAKEYDLAYAHYLSAYSAAKPYLNACDAFVVSALKSKGLLVANEKGSWALQRGCRLTGEFAGAMGVVNIGMREWEAAREMCEVPHTDFYKKKELVCAAVAYVNGDLEGVEYYRRTWSDQTQFDRQLSALLLSGGLKP